MKSEDAPDDTKCQSEYEAEKRKQQEKDAIGGVHVVLPAIEAAQSRCGLQK
jgi:hypothetical protein